MHSISQTPVDIKIPAQRTSGERMLVKALTAIVNREGKKKEPVKKANVFSDERP
jgi:hypothetical protein